MLSLFVQIVLQDRKNLIIFSVRDIFVWCSSMCIAAFEVLVIIKLGI